MSFKCLFSGTRKKGIIQTNPLALRVALTFVNGAASTAGTAAEMKKPSSFDARSALQPVLATSWK